MTNSDSAFKEWCILELMGHRKLGGLVSEQQIAGAVFLRIDIYSSEEVLASQLYSPAAVYCITPCDETIARLYGDRHKPEPVTRWELPSKTAVAGTPEDSRIEIEHYIDEQEDY